MIAGSATRTTGLAANTPGADPGVHLVRSAPSDGSINREPDLESVLQQGQEVPTVEYLVTMTTVVPDGTTDPTIAEVRTREAARSRELAADGHLLRLWRPPLQPGEWRTLGLFSAADEVELEDILASMPLRIWRSDHVVPLSEHPNDPATPRDIPAREFLTTFEVTFPDSASDQEVADLKAHEAARTRELADQGYLVRLWLLPPTPGHWRALGLWRAEDADELQVVLKSLPMNPWMDTETTPLTEHPSDPTQSDS